MADSSEPAYESKRNRSRRAIASYFRRLADALGRGEPVPADAEQTVTVEPPADVDIGVVVDQVGDDVTLGIEMAWTDEDAVIDTDATASKARFEQYVDADDDWRWRLVHQNGNILADSAEGYASKQKATQGLDSVKTNAPGAHVVDHSKDESAPETGGSAATFELYADAEDKWRWRLRHDNGNTIADSGQGYASKQKAKQGLSSVQKNALGAPVETE